VPCYRAGRMSWFCKPLGDKTPAEVPPGECSRDDTPRVRSARDEPLVAQGRR
jgi:hypothetical protein